MPMTDDEILARAREIERQRSDARVTEARTVEARVQALLAGRGEPFALDELRYSASARCPCGAGLAYPLKVGLRGCWDCSAILTGTADVAVMHTDRKPFAFWSIRSEGEGDHDGTTRPAATEAV